MSHLDPWTQSSAPLAVVRAPDAASAPRTCTPAEGTASRATLGPAQQTSTDENVTLGQAARQIGVPTDVLRDLCDSGLVASERRRAGHRYLKAQDLPDRQWIDEQVTQRYRQAVLTAQASARRVAVELEAIALDLAEAAEDLPGQKPLGEDLRRCHELRGLFNDAVCDLRDATAEAATAHHRAATLRRLRPTRVPRAAESA